MHEKSDAGGAGYTGTVYLKEAYEKQEQWHFDWPQYIEFRRLVKKFPNVEPVQAKSGMVYGVGLSQIEPITILLQELRGRSAKNRWRKAKEGQPPKGWMTTEQVMQIMGYPHRNSAYYLKKEVETKIVGGLLLFKGDQVKRRVAKRKDRLDRKGRSS